MASLRNVRREPLIRRLLSQKFDEDLVLEVTRSNSPDVFLAALKRADCPVGLLVDLFQARSPKVRLAVALHPGTPLRVLRLMSKDANEDVASAAHRRT